MGVIQTGNDAVFFVQGFTIRINQIQGVHPVVREVGWDNSVYYDFRVRLKNPDRAFILHYPSRFEALAVRAAIKATWFKRMKDNPYRDYRVIW